MNKLAFLVAYRGELVRRYQWAADSSKLDKFMVACEDTIRDLGNSWNHDGEAVTAAWKYIGGKGKPSLKALRALP